jgi:diadenosine tetraphosphate (Ap4A) HIT family hydrolase
VSAFALDPALLQHGFLLGRTPLCHVLLADNAAVPWFILVPETTAVELCDLDAATHTELFQEVHLLGRALRSTFDVDKLNVAAIGNVVRQLHVHVVGRRREDYCWPDVVWGRPPPERYSTARVAALGLWVASALPGRFTPRRD